MQTPVMLAHPWLSFDGLIAHLMVREKLGLNYYLLPSKEPVDLSHITDKLPFKHTNGLPHASVAQLDTSIVNTATIYKRFDESSCHKIDTKTNRIQIDRGHYRAYMMRLPYLPAQKIVFYGCGDLREVLRLIQYLPGLGKKVAYGYGAIKSVSGETIDEDYSLIRGDVAMRPLPCRLGYKSDVTMRLAWRSPYWDKRNVDVCVAPSAKVNLT
jgi:hypothetical protein